MTRNTITRIFPLGFLLWASVTARALFTLSEAGQPHVWLVAGLLVAYLALWSTERRITARLAWYPHLYLIVQTLLIGVLSLTPWFQDYYVLLFAPLSVQAMWLFQRRVAYTWIAIFTLAMALAMTIGTGWPDALAFIILYGTAYLFVAYFATITEQADAARAESQRLYAELQSAHRQLQEYAAQAEQLAVTQERSRLSRELHDSVTQLLYTLTLYAEAANRQLAAGNAPLAAEQLREMRALAQQALQEMRLLVFELRPLVLEKEGLPAALQARLDAVENRAGLKAELRIAGDGRLPPEIETGLYRIAQEALNNILKHAKARRVTIDLRLNQNPIVLEIADDGGGFEPKSADGRGGLGLRGMHERAEQIGGRLTVLSQPDTGTTVRLEIAR